MLPGLTNWTAVPAPAAAPARVEPAGLAELMGSMGSAETGIVSAGSQPVSVEPVRPGHRSRVPEAFDRRRCNIPLPQRLERRNTGRRSDAVRCCSIYLSSDFSVSDCWFSPPPKNRGWRWFFGSRNSRNEQNETESQCLRGHIRNLARTAIPCGPPCLLRAGKGRRLGDISDGFRNRLTITSRPTVPTMDHAPPP